MKNDYPLVEQEINVKKLIFCCFIAALTEQFRNFAVFSNAKSATYRCHKWEKAEKKETAAAEITQEDNNWKLHTTTCAKKRKKEKKKSVKFHIVSYHALWTSATAR